MGSSAEERERLESDARAAFDRGDLERAATLAVRGYGTEVYSLIASIHRDVEDASDVFAQVTESFWRSLPTFAWECSLRTWLYTLARNASFRFRRDAARKARRGHRVGESALDAVAERVRTETQSYLQTEKRTKVQALRESLPAEDQPPNERVTRTCKPTSAALVTHGAA